ncbi:serine/threonine protein kinase [Nocardioides sp. Root190]|uniref:SDR family oxidoreductase n=1 Tax=Nocardioides sp. Root190 TaxID=1736488 RepID=UPI0006F7C6F5|nr:SDR family oxidoreductase [Nocardioides sp. Root190]KRB80455.1 serine/threonine protein kinase [Nocardioides sp. Root190]
MAGVEGRVVIVTGAGGGLGREYALFLASVGAKVVVNDLGGSRDGSGAGTSMADAVVEEIREAGGEAVANYDSVATEEGATAIVATAIDTFGAVHGLVNNAGILRDTSFSKMDTDAWKLVQAVHLDGGYFMSKAVWPHFREQGFGRIVMATSTSGLFGNFGQANYGAAKAGLVGLLNTLTIEGARDGIQVNAIAPMAATRMTADIAPQELLDKLPPSYVSPVVTYLLSEESTDAGAVFVAGGGQVYRVAQFQNKGAVFSAPPSLREVSERWSEIASLDDVTFGKNPVG